VTEPSGTGTAGGSAARSRPPGRRATVLLTLLGALLILLAGTRTWAGVKFVDTLPGLSELVVPGRTAVPALIPVALAAGAGAVVLAVSARIARLVVSVGLLLAGAAVALTAARTAGDPEGVVSTGLSESLGVYDNGMRTADGRSAAIFRHWVVDFTSWPWVAVAGGVLVMLAGLLALLGGRSWSGPARRYERTPEVGARGRSMSDRAGPAMTGPPTDADPARGTTSPDSAAGTWDALSRGEDPTSPPPGPT
jgi:uncharacterized membrane protein (TIGR02234 family)